MATLFYPLERKALCQRRKLLPVIFALPSATDPKITLNVVSDAVSLVKNLPWIDPTRLYLYGFSRGAFFASLLANRIEEIKAIVLQSGAYDLNRFYQETLWFRSMLN